MAFDLLRALLGTVLLVYASISDWRRREVGDWVWAVMAGAGFLLFALEVYGEEGGPRAYLVLLPPALLILEALRPEVRWSRGLSAILYTGAAASTVGLILLFPHVAPQDQAILRRGFGVLLMVVLAYLFYYLGLLKGGADAKALMSIAILVPRYPTLEPLPLVQLDPVVREAFELLFPFALSTLMNAVILAAALPLLFLGMNVLRGDFRWPQALLGYKASLEALPAFVWVLQEVREGRIVYYVRPRLSPEEMDLEAFRELGIERVWVTPKLPLLVFMTAGFLVAYVVGNLLFAILAALEAV